MGPGVKMSAVDRAAREVIEQAGHGDYFIHITGHGLVGGIMSSRRCWGPGNDEPLCEGMVTSVEPGVYIPGLGGMRIEDNVAVSGTGADVLSTFSREL